MKKQLFCFVVICSLLFCVSSLYAQNRVITGIVVDAESSEPLNYATVVVKDHVQSYAYTGEDGVFVIKNAPNEATHLEVSYLGYNNSIVEIGNQARVIIKLQPENVLLNQVVVTALGIQRQAKEIGYATAKVNSEELTKSKDVDASQALIGKVSGLQISVESSALDADVKINLRGSRSFTGDNQALLVVDGIPTPISFLQSINPNDIENISVLKGGSAAALYGSSASNGVLYVTTKKGERGRPRLTYSFTTTLDQMAYFPKYQTQFGSGAESGTTGFGYYISDENQQYGPEFDGSEVPIGQPIMNANGEIVQLTDSYDFKDGSKEGYYQLGVTLQSDVSFSSNSDNGSFFMSYQNVDRTGTVVNDKYNRHTARFSGSRVYKNLKANVNVSYSSVKTNMNNSASSGMQALWNTSGHIDLPAYKDWQNVEGANPDQWLNSYYPNPYWQIDSYRRENRSDRLSGSASLDYKPLRWLTFQGRVGLNTSISNSNSKTYPWHYSEHAKDTRYNARADVYTALTTSTNYTNAVNTDLMAFVKHDFSDKLKFKAMVGWSLQDSYREYKSVGASQLEVDGIFNMSNRVGELSGGNDIYQTRKQSVYASMDFAYNDWLFLQLTGRNDWTSLLSPDQWSFFYPGANMSMMLSDVIPALDNLKWLSYLKLRGSYSMIGSVNIGTYQLDDLAFAYSDFPFGSLTSYYISKNLRNNQIEPEFTTEFEVGIEAGFLRDRIVFEAAAYQQVTDGQTVNISMPISTGANSRYTNAGTMRGRGVELDLKLTPLLELGDFNWNLNANATFTETIVTELYDNVTEIPIYSAVYAIEGMAYPTIKATDYERDPQGRVIINPNTGLPVLGGLKEMGTTEPTVRIGLTSTFNWKNLSVSATFDYRGGAVTRFAHEYEMLFTGASYTSALMGRQRFVFPNSVIEVTNADGSVTYEENTNITVNSGNKDFWTSNYRSCRAATVVSADVWKLRSASINYDLPEKLLNKIGFIQSASVGLVGRNLFMWTPDTNLWGDPESFAGNGGYSNATGMSSNGIAGSRTFGFNVLVSF